MSLTRVARFAALGLFNLSLTHCGTNPSNADDAANTTSVGTDGSTQVPATNSPSVDTQVTASPNSGPEASPSNGPAPQIGGTTQGPELGPPAPPTAGGTTPEPPNPGDTGVNPEPFMPPSNLPTGMGSNVAPLGTGGGPAVPPAASGGAGGGNGAGGADGHSSALDAGAGDTDPGPENAGATTLKDKYDGYFLFGAAVDSQSYNTYSQILTTHFSSVTSENDMKWESLEPQEGNFTWDAADRMVDWAVKNNMQVRGHTLVWHRQTPSWVFEGTKDQVLGRMQAHIKAVLNHFHGKVQVWDVVNEAVLNDGSFRTGDAPVMLDQSGWYRACGEDYIAAAFRYAHDADPDVKLFYNDYYEYLPDKRKGVVALLKRLIDDGVPIDGVGMQSHINIQPSTDMTHQSYYQTVDNLEDTIKAYADLGLEVQVTEMDQSLYIGGVTYDPSQFYTVQTFTPELQQQQADRYREFFELYRKYRKVITRVTFWGVADDNTWLSEFDSGRQDFPLLFDVDHKPKKAFDAVMDF
jgi:endo-1,4-beta-xylanase